MTAPGLWTTDQRADRLTAETQAMARNGWRVEQRYGSAATVVRSLIWMRPLAHLALAVCTFGLWLPVWLALLGPHARKRRLQVAVDEWGRVSVTKVRVSG